MIESYVDLLYRGLPLARRVKLTSVRPREGYVEMPAPMPVGTLIRIGTDEGVAIEARVIGVTEQTGGATGTPGMQIAPVLDGAAASWWSARVALPDAPPAPKRMIIQPSTPNAMAAVPTVAPAAPITAPMPAVSPSRSPQPSPPPPDAMDAATIPMPVIDDDGAPEIEITDDRHDKRTMVMEAVVAEELLAQVAAADSNPRLTNIVDDGKQTQVMEAVDLSALGLDSSASGSLHMTTVGDDGPDTASDGDKSTPNSTKRKRKKR